MSAPFRQPVVVDQTPGPLPFVARSPRYDAKASALLLRVLFFANLAGFFGSYVVGDGRPFLCSMLLFCPALLFPLYWACKRLTAQPEKNFSNPSADGPMGGA